MLAFELPHSVFLIPGLLFFIIGFSLLTIAKFWPSDGIWPFTLWRKPVVTAVWPVQTAHLDEDVEMAQLQPLAAATTAGAAAAQHDTAVQPAHAERMEEAAHAQRDDATAPFDEPVHAVHAAPVADVIERPSAEPTRADAPGGMPSIPSHARAITWPSRVDADAGILDESQRRRVIDGLGIVGDAWCATILAHAFNEEDDELRIAAVESLGTCSGDIVAPTLERAYTSAIIAERYAAIDGASRQGDIALLNQALRDTDATVALAAAYGLHRANRTDLIDSALRARTDPQATQIRTLLPLLQ